MKELDLSSKQTMTLKEITDLLEVRHNDAMKTVSKMAESIEFGELRKIRSAIIKRWKELENNNQPSIPKNYAEALRLAADQQEQIEAKNKSLAFKDDLLIASNEASIKAGDILVEEFCKSTDIVNIGRNKMYDWMREQGYVFKASTQPIQQYVNSGIFKWLPTDEKVNGKIRYTLFITARGKVWLAAKYMQYIDKSLFDNYDT